LPIVACKFVTKSIYIENTETKQKQRLMVHNIDQFLSPFAVKKTVFCIHARESSVYFGCWDVFVSVAVVLQLWRGSHCREFKISVDVWTIYTSQNKYPLSVLQSSFDTPVALISTLTIICYFIGELYQQQASSPRTLKAYQNIVTTVFVHDYLYCLYTAYHSHTPGNNVSLPFYTLVHEFTTRTSS